MDKLHNVETDFSGKVEFVPPIEIEGKYDIIARVWLEHYHKLTGREGAPVYDSTGSLFWWIVKYTPDHQSEILRLCFEAGYKAAINEIRKRIVKHKTKSGQYV